MVYQIAISFQNVTSFDCAAIGCEPLPGFFGGLHELSNHISKGRLARPRGADEKLPARVQRDGRPRRPRRPEQCAAPALASPCRLAAPSRASRQLRAARQTQAAAAAERELNPSRACTRADPPPAWGLARNRAHTRPHRHTLDPIRNHVQRRIDCVRQGLVATEISAPPDQRADPGPEGARAVGRERDRERTGCQGADTRSCPESGAALAPRSEPQRGVNNNYHA